jgi:hypothetical protein
VVWLYESALSLQYESVVVLTLNEALYGMPMGRFAKTANPRFASGLRNARLCDISWIARKRFWFAVAPMTYAVRKNGHENIGVSRSIYAQKVCKDTTKATTYFVRGSGPQSLVTYRTAVSVRLS